MGQQESRCCFGDAYGCNTAATEGFPETTKRIRCTEWCAANECSWCYSSTSWSWRPTFEGIKCASANDDKE